MYVLTLFFGVPFTVPIQRETISQVDYFHPMHIARVLLTFVPRRHCFSLCSTEPLAYLVSCVTIEKNSSPMSGVRTLITRERLLNKQAN